MRYREYKGYTIVKDFVTNDFSIKRDGKYLHYGICKTSFLKLKDARAFIDRLENGEINSGNYNWR